MYILNNEASAGLKRALTKYDLKYQLVPSHVHCRNAAKHAIHTYKNHLLSFLATCDPDIPSGTYTESTSFIASEPTIFCLCVFALQL
jgi:hypothetical protein